MPNYRKIWINTLLLSIYLIIIITVYKYQEEIRVFTNNHTLIKIVYIFLIILSTNSLVKILEENINHRYEKERPEKIFVIESITRAVIWTISTLIILAMLFSSWKNILTLLGILGAGLVVALQQPILNFLGWFILLIGRFYVIGDRVEIDGIKGDVVEITAMYTKLRRLTNKDEPTGSSISIPNHYILSKPIINYSKPSKYVWDEIRVSITYESNIEKAKKVLMESLYEAINYEEESKKAIRKKKIRFEDMKTAPRIRIELMDSSIDLILRYLVEIRKKNEIHVKVLNNIIEKIKKSKNISFAYPHIQIVK